MAEQKMTQLKIKSGVFHMTTWVDTKPGLVVGAEITLKDDPRIWTIEAVFDTRLRSEVNKGKFDNNNYDKHKGLGL